MTMPSPLGCWLGLGAEAILGVHLMSALLKWSALALFCTLWGFMGALGGVWLMADQLRGERGPTGLAGPAGPTGVAGPVGPAPDMSELTDAVGQFMTMVEGTTANLNRRIEDLERESAFPESTSLTTFGCSATDPSVVTDVTLTPGIGYDPFLSVRRASICVR
jgi:hypothetical protein